MAKGVSGSMRTRQLQRLSWPGSRLLREQFAARDDRVHPTLVLDRDVDGHELRILHACRRDVRAKLSECRVHRQTWWRGREPEGRAMAAPRPIFRRDAESGRDWVANDISDHLEEIRTSFDEHGLVSPLEHVADATM